MHCSSLLRVRDLTSWVDVCCYIYDTISKPELVITWESYEIDTDTVVYNRGKCSRTTSTMTRDVSNWEKITSHPLPAHLKSGKWPGWPETPQTYSAGTWLNSHTGVMHYHKTLIYLQATLYPKRRVTVHNEHNWFLQHSAKISLWLDGTNVVDWLTDWPHPTGQSLAPWGWFWRWLFAVSRRRSPLTRALPHGCCMLMIHTETEPCWLFGCFQGCRRCICCSRILARLTCHCH